MSIYRVIILPSAQRKLRSLPRSIRTRIRGRIDALVTDPRPPGVKKLRGLVNRYRLRVSDYRVIYKIEDKRLVVIIMEVAHRRDAYRR